MSSYLLALAVGRFDSIQAAALLLAEGLPLALCVCQAQTSNGTLIRILTVPEQAEFGRFALDVAVRALAYYEDACRAKSRVPSLARTQSTPSDITKHGKST